MAIPAPAPAPVSTPLPAESPAIDGWHAQRLAKTFASSVIANGPARAFWDRYISEDRVALDELADALEAWMMKDGISPKEAMGARQRLVERLQNPADNSAELAEQAEKLRQELSTLRVSDIRRRAVASGVDTAHIDDADDSDSPKAALIDLIVAATVSAVDPSVEQAAAQAAAQAQRQDEMRTELTSLRVSGWRACAPSC